MALEEYRAKRTFESTPEPTGGQGSGPLHFVVQKHSATALHYDFRLEMGGVMKSWAIPKGPSLNPADKHLAMMTEDHPLDYRFFEGVIPKGNYGAGPVMIWDEGTYEPLGATGNPDADDKLARAGVHQEHLTFILHGQKLNGEFALIKMAHADEKNAWLIVKAHKDEFISEADVTQQDRSVITSRTIEEIKSGQPITQLHLTEFDNAPTGQLPKHPTPMLATLAKAPFDSPEWLYEVKWDGYRIMAELGPSGPTLHSRRGQDYTQTFQPVADALAPLRVPALLDGEMVIVDNAGRPSFQDLQNYLRTHQGRLLYCAFDLIHLAGHDLTSQPLTARKHLLKRLLGLISDPHLQYSDEVIGQGTALFGTARTQGLEGIMAKRGDSLYALGRRSHDWLKFKTHRRQEAVVVGYTEPRVGRQYFGALVLGVYDASGRLAYAGHTGSGFDDADLKTLHERLKSLETPTSPIQPEPKTNEPAHWVRPELVAEIEFTEWTEDGSMRHPIFAGLRDDKDPREVKREEEATVTEPKRNAPSPKQATGKARPKLTHLDKIYWPGDGITKGDLIAYYERAAPVMLPYLKDRPQSLHRFPNGITGEDFYQKDVETHPSWARTAIIHSDSAGKDISYIIADDAATILYLINLGCIELNPWNSRVSQLENPDWAVIDLDPEDIGFESVIETAQAVHAVLGELDVPSYPKTSGATGIHIYIPMGAKYDYDQVKLFAQLIAQLAHARVPNITSVERSPAKRQGKVYLDYLQNRHGQTLAAAYSVRPRPGATVSMPLEWSEVKPGLTPQQFTIHNAHERFNRDAHLWRPVLGSGIDLTAILKAAENQS
jgi:bifunctional non-homologous end joining protein LigD